MIIYFSRYEITLKLGNHELPIVNKTKHKTSTIKLARQIHIIGVLMSQLKRIERVENSREAVDK